MLIESFRLQEDAKVKRAGHAGNGFNFRAASRVGFTVVEKGVYKRIHPTHFLLNGCSKVL